MVISAAVREASQLPNASVVSFCQAVSRSSLVSLEVLSAQKRSEFDWMWSDTIRNSTKQRIRRHYVLEKFLEPFEMLHNVGNFTINEVAVPDRLADCTIDEDERPTPIHFDLGFLSASMKLLVEGHSTCERVFLMHQRLVDYAQAFERYEPFRSGMQFSVGKTKKLRHDRQEEPWNAPRDHPFKQTPLHPVEEGLEPASIASDANDLLEFQIQRKIVLEYLEPQYQRIAQLKITWRYTLWNAAIAYSNVATPGNG